MNNQIVDLKNFILSTRDSGYKSISYALAEIIDNSFEAEATDVKVYINKDNDEFEVAVLDNGIGMHPSTLALSLRFGGTTRFKSTNYFGRYGMGLPNSSFSQCRRLEVYSWKNYQNVNWNYLDIDEIVSGKYERIPSSKKRVIPKKYQNHLESGTLVIWKKIDRLSYKTILPVLNKLHQDLGKTYRALLYGGKTIILNDKRLMPFDRLYLNKGRNPTGGKQYGQDMEFPIKINQIESLIKVRFVELPINEWAKLPNKEKRKIGITKNAGVSILRHGREIDYGWFFMGKKRKENYDDWWRCEVSFESILDDLFGITHTKQMINPTRKLNDILEQHIESVGQKLNYRVRLKFIELNEENNKPEEIKIAEKNDFLIEPPLEVKKFSIKTMFSRGEVSKFKGLKYSINQETLATSALFLKNLNGHSLDITMNSNHPFYKSYLDKINRSGRVNSDVVRKLFYLMILAMARAELKLEGNISDSFRTRWGNILKKYLSN